MKLDGYKFQRGDIWYYKDRITHKDLKEMENTPTEKRGSRPVLIISSTLGYDDTCCAVVLPITHANSIRNNQDKLKQNLMLPVHLRAYDISYIQCSRIMTVKGSDLVSYWCHLSLEKMEQVEGVLSEYLGLLTDKAKKQKLDKKMSKTLKEVRQKTDELLSNNIITLNPPVIKQHHAYNSDWIYCKELDMIFKSVRELQQMLDVSYSTARSYANNGHDPKREYTFKRVPKGAEIKEAQNG